MIRAKCTASGQHNSIIIYSPHVNGKSGEVYKSLMILTFLEFYSETSLWHSPKWQKKMGTCFKQLKNNNIIWLYTTLPGLSKSSDALRSQIDSKRQFSHPFKAEIFTVSAKLQVSVHPLWNHYMVFLGGGCFLMFKDKSPFSLVG